MRCIPIFFLALSGIFSANGFPNAKSAARALEARYHGGKSFEAAFLESYKDGKGSASAESGTLYLSRPGRMRWEYESPEKKLFLVDGANVWFYVPADRTASRAKIKDSSDWRTPIALLAGKANLSQLCRNVEVVPHSAAGDSGEDDLDSAAGDMLLRCEPRGGDNGPQAPQEILLEVNPQAFLDRVTIREPGDITLEFRFGNWQENIPIPETKFHFQPPPGVAVVDEQTLAGELR